MTLPVAPFKTNYCIELAVDIDNAVEDRRRIVAEAWCCIHAASHWFRSVDKRSGTVRFSFADYRDAIAFWLAN
jgi:hypothetical protein